MPDVESVDKVRLSRLVERATECARAGDAEGLRATEGAIDEIVYRLYGLTPAEIAIIEGREAGGKKAASAVKPVKAAAGAKKPRKSVLTEDPDLA